jgi:anti-sigma factor RsiW
MKHLPENLMIKALLKETSEKEAVQLQQWIQHDAKAATQLRDWKSIDAKLKTYQPDFKPGFSIKILNKIRQRRMAQKEIYHWMLRGSMGAAAAVLILLMYVLWQDNSLSIESVLGLKGLISEDFTNLLATY